MTGKLASLLTARARAALDFYQPLDWRDTVRVVYPRIAEAAYRGETKCFVHTKLNDSIVKTLRDAGFVVRYEQVLGMVGNVSIEWGDQAVWGANGQVMRISPVEYNLDWERYERQRNIHLTA